MWQASANRNMGTWDDITGSTAGALRLNMVAFACGVGIWDKCLVWFHLSEVYLEASKNKGLFSTKNESHWQVYARFNSFFFDLNNASCFSMAFFDVTPGCFGSSLLAEPLAGGEMKWTWDWWSSNPKDAESQHATPRMDAWSMTFHFHRVIFRFCEAESCFWTMVLIPWKELVLSELVYHMLQVAAIVGKPSQQFVDQERCDVAKWTENPKIRFEPFSATLQLVGFLATLQLLGVFWLDTYPNSEADMSQLSTLVSSVLSLKAGDLIADVSSSYQLPNDAWWCYVFFEGFLRCWSFLEKTVSRQVDKIDKSSMKVMR